MSSYILSDGRVVELDWDGECEMEVWTTGGTRERVGSFEFFRSEGPSNFDEETYLVTGLDLEGAGGTYLHKGIGREIFRRLVEEEGLKIVFSPLTGNRRDDGSHLTGDGPSFANKMITEGFAFWDDAGVDWDRDTEEYGDKDSD